MQESHPDVVELAKKQRHLYLLRKVREGKLLSIKEIGELDYYEHRRQSRNKKHSNKAQDVQPVEK
ncbi:MAG: hypothetical protein JW837_18275 [Sedimentisphaerales bacterium]|nr:hypothetical protein [Sedimentisphaerales bacterium]